ncbi:hypothetical protein PVAP13_9KG377132 [Panicum virgatum]|uniref:Uncharacterized protein n=1 Tax=Panicum virgatum TaxID=38727 RepID=A0A8T0NTC3_PANVG|nr:hypothetical protein PVAP13_9KG377132 [Panicum virgatum]
MLLEEFFSVQHGEYVVSRFDPEDFLVEFSSEAVAYRILHAHHPDEAPFQLIWKRWCRQSMASFASLHFRILIEFRGIPAHARNITTARILLGTSCSGLVEAPPKLAGDNRKKFFVCAWCIHPDLVPQEKVIFIQEPSEQYVETGLFLRPHEIIHSKHDGLWYRVQIRIVEIQDWNLSSDSLDDGTPPDNFDSDEDEYPGFEQRCRSKPWPKITRFDDGVGSSSDPQLGPGWGPPFRSQGQAMERSLMGNSWQPWSSSKHLSLGADQGMNTATSMVGTVRVVDECPLLKLPLRFGRCSSVRQGAPEICHGDRASLSGAGNAGSRGAPPTPLPDSATVQVTSAVMGPVTKTFEPMQFEFNGRKVALLYRSGQEEEDKRLLHGPFIVEDDRYDPMLEEVSGSLLGPVLGCLSPRPRVVSPAGEESQAACRSRRRT